MPKAARRYYKIPYMRNGKRDYKRENKEYNSRPEQKERRAARNAARRKMEKDGKVSKGDGKDVDHKKPLSKGGGNSSSNLRVKKASSNRSFSRNKDGSMKRK